jgi:hypothetical protein
MANLIQIKRSLNSSTPGSLANGELAFTANGDVLYIGSNSTVVAIGGKRVPGTLTANQALVANATSYLDAIKVANATIDKVYANGTFGTAGQVLTSNSTGGVYFAAPVTNLDGLSDVEVTSASAGQILIANSTGFFRNKSLSGDITIDSDGLVSIAADSVALGTDTTGNYVATITAGAGISGSSSSEGGTPTIAVVANSGIVSNSSGVFANTDNSTLELSGGVIRVKDDGIALGTKTTGNYVATITAGNGISGSSSTEGGAPTIAVVAGNGIASNSTGVHVVAGTGVVSNSTGVHIGQAIGTTDNVTFNDLTVNGNTIIGNASSDRVTVNAQLSSDIIPSANITYSLGNNTLRFLEVHAQNAHSEYLYVDKDVTVSGNLTVSGSLVTINVATLSVTDSLIQLASNNTLSDSLDIGFYGSYQVGGGDHEHTGLFRDATTDTYKLFKGLTLAPTTTVDVTGTGYTQATLEAYLSSGGLSTNSTAVALTANSTVAVSITANSLTLSTPLVGTSGGTGLASYTAEDILVANSSNGFRKLAAGSEGYVLQISGGVVAYGTLDGGTF